ncbi:MAG: cystathionine beta-synthase [Myxococcales bacterium]|nr:cystathionine beta-synthase [Myxococcales bacterium]
MTGSVPHVLDAIGQTPLVRLNQMAAHVPANIYVKLEYLNPGGSTKDRIGLNIINQAEAAGLIQPGGTIVEATSGNTGMGLALVAAVRGYKCIFVMPDKMSEEKIASLRAVGAKVIMTPTNVEPDDPRSYYSVSRRIAEETPNAFYANQYFNPSNPQSHYLSTGPELWHQTGGEIDVFVAGLGTGGTICGTGRYLREHKPEIKLIGADPIGSIYYDLKRTGKMVQAHPYKVEGVGEDILPSTIDIDIIDEIIQVTDHESFHANRDLARKEGVLTGGSGGLAVMAAIRYAERTQKEENIVVLLPDSAMRYLTKQFNDTWMAENGFLGPETSVGTVADLLAEQTSLISLAGNTIVSEAVALMRENDVSQLPVLADDGSVLGVLTERNLLQHLLSQPNDQATAADLVESNFATAELDTPLSALAPHFRNHQVVLVTEGDQLTGIVTEIDLLERLTQVVGG